MNFHLPVFLFSIFLAAISSLSPAAEEHVSSGGMRIWKEADSERTLKGRIQGKRADGSEIRILLENHKAIWLPVSKLANEDREFAAKWELLDLRLSAQTVAMGAERSRWTAVWTASTRDTADILAVAGSEKLQNRTVGVTIDNRGTLQNIVVDVFWFGFPLDDKNQRHVCARATKVVQVPPENSFNISCGIGYRNREESLTYAHLDARKQEITALFVDSWSGKTYAGWAVRISDMSGKILGQTASLSPLLGYLSEVPAPVSKKTR
jgi:hypothetical protein